VNVNGMFDEEMGMDMYAFQDANALGWVDLAQDDETPIILYSPVVCMPAAAEEEAADLTEQYEILMPTDLDPEVIVNYREETDVEPYRNYVLAGEYAGMGSYLLMEVEQEQGLVI